MLKSAKQFSQIIAAIFLILASSTLVRAGNAPFGDKVSAALLNYNRAAPEIGSAGKLGAGGVAEAKALGFVTIVDLRTPEEGTAAEKAEAAKIGIGYVNISIASKAPLEDQIKAFAKIVEDPARQPVLVHCASANRVGAIWALYRASKGVPAMVAVEEGRTLGLKPSREAAVRARLGLPPLKK